jgi:hypothetical protein
MKAKIQRSVKTNEGEIRPSKFDPTKKSCPVLVETPDGKLYTIFANEGTVLWSQQAGEEVDIEITKEPEGNSRGMAKIAGGKKFAGFGQRVFAIPPTETAKAACDYMAMLHKAMHGRLPDATPETIAAYCSAIFNRTT